jgi:uncharacterized protein
VVLGGHEVINILEGFHGLLDDGAFIQVHGGVVGGGADELHAAGVGLVVRLSAGERWQEGMVNVDDAVSKWFHQGSGEHLHVASQDHQIDLVLFKAVENLGLLLRFVLGGEGEMLEGAAKTCGEGLKVLVVAHHQGDIGSKFAFSLTKQDIVEAVIVLGYEDGHPVALVFRAEFPSHPESVGDFADALLQGDAVGPKIGEVETNALEENVFDGVGVLVAVENVGPVSVENLGQRGDDAPLVGAADQERSNSVGFVGHSPRSLSDLSPRLKGADQGGSTRRRWRSLWSRRSGRVRGRFCGMVVGEALAAALIKEPEVRFAYLFGSVARGTVQPGSDVDVAVWVDEAMELWCFSALAERLGEAVPGVRLDLVDLRRASPLLAFQVVQEGQVLLERTPEERFDFEQDAVRRYEDTRPLRAVQEAIFRERMRS